MAVLVAAACLTARSADYVTDDVNVGMSRLVIRCLDKVQTDRMGFYAAKCSVLLDNALGIHERQDDALCVQEVADGEPEKAVGQERFCVYYRPSEDELSFVLRLFRQLLNRRLEQLTRHRAKATPFSSVLVSGLSYRYARGRNSLSGYYEPDYELARNQFMRHDFPEVAVLLKSELTPEHPSFFELYMMHCDLLLLCIEAIPEKKVNIVSRMLQAEQSGGEAFAVLDKLTVPYRAHGEALQKFYERMVLRMSRRRRRMSGEDVIAERVKELETVPVVGLEGRNALRHVALEEVPDALKDYCNDMQGVFRLESRFRELQMAAPYLLRDSLGAYAKAVSWIRERNIPRFRKEIAVAREQFRQALGRQKKLNEMMDAYELEHVPALKRFQDFVDIQHHYRKLERKLYPKDALGKLSKDSPADAAR